MLLNLMPRTALVHIARHMLVLMLATILAGSLPLRAHDSGTMLSLEMRLAPYLAVGGSLSDLCEDDGAYCPGCVACDDCTMQPVFALPANAALPARQWRFFFAFDTIPEPSVLHTCAVPAGFDARGPPLNA